MAKKNKSKKTSSTPTKTDLAGLLRKFNESESDEEQSDNGKQSILLVKQNRDPESEKSESEKEKGDSSNPSKETPTGKKSDMSSSSDKNSEKHITQQTTDKTGVSDKIANKSDTAGKSSRMELDESEEELNYDSTSSESVKDACKTNEDDDDASMKVSPLCSYTTAALCDEQWAEMTKLWLIKASKGIKFCEALCRELNIDIQEEDCRKTPKTKSRVQKLLQSTMAVLESIKRREILAIDQDPSSPSDKPRKKSSNPSDSSDNSESEDDASSLKTPHVKPKNQVTKSKFFIPSVSINGINEDAPRNNFLGLRFGGQALSDEEFRGLELKSLPDMYKYIEPYPHDVKIRLLMAWVQSNHVEHVDWAIRRTFHKDITLSSKKYFPSENKTQVGDSHNHHNVISKIDSCKHDEQLLTEMGKILDGSTFNSKTGSAFIKVLDSFLARKNITVTATQLIRLNVDGYITDRSQYPAKISNCLNNPDSSTQNTPNNNTLQIENIGVTSGASDDLDMPLILHDNEDGPEIQLGTVFPDSVPASVSYGDVMLWRLYDNRYPADLRGAVDTAVTHWCNYNSELLTCTKVLPVTTLQQLYVYEAVQKLLLRVVIAIITDMVDNKKLVSFDPVRRALIDFHQKPLDAQTALKIPLVSMSPMTFICYVKKIQCDIGACAVYMLIRNHMTTGHSVIVKQFTETMLYQLDLSLGLFESYTLFLKGWTTNKNLFPYKFDGNVLNIFEEQVQLQVIKNLFVELSYAQIGTMYATDVTAINSEVQLAQTVSQVTSIVGKYHKQNKFRPHPVDSTTLSVVTSPSSKVVDNMTLSEMSQSLKSDVMKASIPKGAKASDFFNEIKGVYVPIKQIPATVYKCFSDKTKSAIKPLKEFCKANSNHFAGTTPNPSKKPTNSKNDAKEKQNRKGKKSHTDSSSKDDDLGENNPSTKKRSKDDSKDSASGKDDDSSDRRGRPHPRNEPYRHDDRSWNDGWDDSYYYHYPPGPPPRRGKGGKGGESRGSRTWHNSNYRPSYRSGSPGRDENEFNGRYGPSRRDSPIPPTLKGNLAKDPDKN